MVAAAHFPDRSPTRLSQRPPAHGWRSSARGMGAAWVASFLGVAYAGVSVYWGLGGTGLLETVGGSLESAGRRGGLVVSVALWGVAGLKVVAVVVPLLAVRRERNASWHRTVWALAWAECAILISYGLVFTGVGLLVQADIIPTGAGADHHALAWHAFFWDPWFLGWGLCVFAALRLARLDRRPGTNRHGHRV
jgi:hypothetical protein